MMKKCLICLLLGFALIAIPSLVKAGYVDTLTAMPGLVSYWDLNEASGTTAADSVIDDLIDGNNSGIYIGSGITVGDAGPRPSDGWTGFSVDNMAPSFTKTPDAKLEMFNSYGYSGLENMSMIGWYRITDPDAISLSNMFGGLQQTDYPRYTFAVNHYPTSTSGFISQEAGTEVSQLTMTTTATGDPGDWHFLAMTYENGTTGKLYIDGTLVSSSEAETALGLEPVVAMVFGNDIGATERALHGQLDELAMFNRALTQTDVENLFVAAGGSLPEPPAEPGSTATAPFAQTATSFGSLKNYWSFLETSGSTAVDSVSGNTGTFVNVSGDLCVLDQPGPNPTVTHDGYAMEGFAADNTSAQFVWNAGGNYMESENGQVIGDPETGTTFAEGVSELTMSLWFKNNFAGQGYIAGFAEESTTGRYVFSMYSPDDKNITFYAKSDNETQLGGTVQIDESAEDWQWHHLVQVWDGEEKRLRIYVDGEEKFNRTNDSMTSNLIVPDGFYIGRDVPGNTRNLGGYVDEVMLFDEALTAEQVFELYDSAFFESNQIPGDANKDGKVDGSDVTILAGNWQYGVDGNGTASWEMGDFNGDGKVDGSDVTILAGNWQYGVTSAASSVPEPSVLVLLASFSFVVLAWRRRKN